MAAHLIVRPESWPLARAFAISRGSRTSSEVVVAEIHEDGLIGRGECMPYPRYNETVEQVAADIATQRDAIGAGMDRAALQDAMPPGAARNALDCALWDLDAKKAGEPVWRLAGLPKPAPLVTAYTLSLDAPEAMGAAARENAERPLLKMKLMGEGDLERVAAVRENAPGARIIVDANEGWESAMVERFSTALMDYGVEMIEQPLPASDDSILATCAHPIAICADESCHVSGDIAELAARYDMINIKLDKTGGLTGALTLRDAANAAGLGVMIGCMIGTSLAMAPAVLVAQGARVVDLDGPLLLAKDREMGLSYDGSVVSPSEPALWG
jgi:L-alanine-DL-glutamate epimerase-like enolase superfamily enzyme